MQFGKNVIFCAPAQMLDQPIRREAAAAVAIAPGSVINLDANGDFALGEAEYSYVADKDHLKGGDVDTDISVGARVVAYVPTSGLFLNVRGKASDAFSEDAPVWAQADGTVTAVHPTVPDGAGGTTEDPDAVVYGYAAETVTLGASGGLVTVKFK